MAEKVNISINSGIDWLEFTTPESIQIPGKKQALKRGMNHYDGGNEYDCGAIELFSHREDMHNHYIFSGSTLRELEYESELRPQSFIKQSAKSKYTRLDIFVDIYQSELSIDTLAFLAEHKICKTKATIIDYFQRLSDGGKTLGIGRRGGSKYARIYDKGIEQKVDLNWKRVELELKHKHATVIARKMIEKKWLEIIPKTIVSFVDFPMNSDWHDAFGCEPSRIIVEKPPPPNTERWLLDVVAPSLARYDIKSGDDFFTRFADAYMLAREAEKRKRDI